MRGVRQGCHEEGGGGGASRERENVGLKEEKESVHEGGLPFDRSHFVTESGERSW